MEDRGYQNNALQDKNQNPAVLYRSLKATTSVHFQGAAIIDHI
jgi:hypothetical protein